MEIAREAAANIGGDGTQDYRVRAIAARMNKQYKAAEKIYMQMVDAHFVILHECIMMKQNYIEPSRRCYSHVSDPPQMG